MDVLPDSIMGWKNTELVGTKNGSNTTFSVPFAMRVGSELIHHNNASVTESSGSPSVGEYSINGSVVTMGAAPDSGDRLKIRGYEI